MNSTEDRTDARPTELLIRDGSSLPRDHRPTGVRSHCGWFTGDRWPERHQYPGQSPSCSRCNVVSLNEGGASAGGFRRSSFQVAQTARSGPGLRIGMSPSTIPLPLLPDPAEEVRAVVGGTVICVVVNWDEVVLVVVLAIEEAGLLDPPPQATSPTPEASRSCPSRIPVWARHPTDACTPNDSSDLGAGHRCLRCFRSIAGSGSTTRSRWTAAIRFPTTRCRQRVTAGQRPPLACGVALDGPIDGRTSHPEQVAELGDAVLAGPVQRDEVGLLADVEPGLLPPQGPFAFATLIPSRLRIRMRSPSNSATMAITPAVGTCLIKTRLRG